ncbi:MAG TPA: hypothetical protein VN833_08040, partial [Candidatus Acidoferrales bacterium]|nr:hypothetical protein [Candidatus Acidoferrales bacterium]
LLSVRSSVGGDGWSDILRETWTHQTEAARHVQSLITKSPGKKVSNSAAEHWVRLIHRINTCQGRVETGN